MFDGPDLPYIWNSGPDSDVGKITVSATSTDVVGYRWAVDTEPDLTAEAYALLDCGGAESCGCEACFNFAATRHLVYYPPSVFSFYRPGRKGA